MEAKPASQRQIETALVESTLSWLWKMDIYVQLLAPYWLILLSHFSRVRLSVTPIDGSSPGSPVPGILQARTLEWVAISFSNAWKWKVKVKSLSHVWLFATPWTAAYQAPLSMGFSRQEYWSGVPLPSPIISIRVNKIICELRLAKCAFIPRPDNIVDNIILSLMKMKPW